MYGKIKNLSVPVEFCGLKDINFMNKIEVSPVQVNTIVIVGSFKH